MLHPQPDLRTDDELDPENEFRVTVRTRPPHFHSESKSSPAETIETNFNLARHFAVTARLQKGVTSRGGWTRQETVCVFVPRGDFSLLLPGAVLPGCAAGFPNGELTATRLSRPTGSTTISTNQ